MELLGRANGRAGNQTGEIERDGEEITSNDLAPGAYSRDFYS